MAYARKTHDEYRLFGKYADGWEELTAETSSSAIRSRYKEYRLNEPKTTFKWTGPHRVKNEVELAG